MSLPNNALKKFLTKLANNNLLLLLAILTITHVIILAIYFKHTTGTLHTNHQYNMNHVFLKLVINASQHLTPAELQHSIDSITRYDLKLNNYRVIISIDARPKWELRFKQNTPLNVVDQTLLHSTQHIRLSYQVTPELWLNYAEYPIATSYNIAVILILMEMTLIGLILFYNFSLQRFTIPLQNFKQSAERLGIDVNATPIRVYGTKLVQETANAMNKMQARLQDLINTRTKMLAAISHDLRTPITRLKLRAYLIEDDSQAKKILADLDDMEAMINSILLFAREDFSQNKKIVFDLNSLLASICDDFSDNGYPIHANLLGERLPYLGCPLALKRTFNNLIQNALKYAGKVWVQLNVNAKKIAIIIEDNGPGIPEQELQKVFQAYYRAKNTVSESSTGAGLGLTIAYEIIHAHNGTIKLRNREHCSGLQVIITLPNEHI
jgi:signal transduction histidine kinase